MKRAAILFLLFAACSGGDDRIYVLSSGDHTFGIPRDLRVDGPTWYLGKLENGDDDSRSLLIELPLELSVGANSTIGPEMVRRESVVGVFTAARDAELKRYLSAREAELKRINGRTAEFALATVTWDSDLKSWRIYTETTKGRRAWVQTQCSAPLMAPADVLGHCTELALATSPRCIVSLVGDGYVFTTHLSPAELELTGVMAEALASMARDWRM